MFTPDPKNQADRMEFLREGNRSVEDQKIFLEGVVAAANAECFAAQELYEQAMKNKERAEKRLFLAREHLRRLDRTKM